MALCCAFFVVLLSSPVPIHASRGDGYCNRYSQNVLAVAAASVVVELSPGELLFRQNAAADSVYFILDGTVETVHTKYVVKRNYWPVSHVPTSRREVEMRVPQEVRGEMTTGDVSAPCFA